MSHYPQLRHVSSPSLEGLADIVHMGQGIVSRDKQIDARVNHATVEGIRIGAWVTRNVDLSQCYSEEPLPTGAPSTTNE